MSYCLYLRKSRADIEAEAHGEGETLARHEKILLELAKKMQLNITQIYREIVSGETIASRPVVQQLLSEVEQGMWEGVLVVEIERLARGDTIDQGIIAQTFKYSDTKIITPMKVYDPNNEYDEEYFEFGLFMSRREYKTINRRLQQGRVASAKEGKYASGKAPYGYRRVRIPNDKGFTLEIVEDEAEIVRYIFQLYIDGYEDDKGVHHPSGTRFIAKRLDELKISPPGSASYWQDSTIRTILKNPTYIGKIRWNTKKSKKVMINGIVKYERVTPPPEEQILVDGIHEPIVSADVFNRAQEILSQKGPAPVRHSSDLKNPFAGLIICGKCSRVMVRSRYQSGEPSINCQNRTCDNVSSKFDIVETRILQALRDWMDGYKIDLSGKSQSEEAASIELKRKSISKSEKEIDTLRKQLDRTHDLLEQGIYDTDMFLERSRSISERMAALESSIAETSESLSMDEKRLASRKSIIPKVEHLLSVYDELPSPAAKNEMLKDVVEKIVYTKEKRSPRNSHLDDFEIVIYPKLPPSE